MKNILVINSSLQGVNGNSFKLTDLFIQTLSSQHTLNVQTLNLVDEELPHLSEKEMQAWQTPVKERTSEQKRLAGWSERYIGLINAADVIVFGVPMYNFDSPSVLKAFFDRIARAGITFAYTENGPQGLIADKQVFVLAARGGQYSGGPLDTQTAYLKNFLGFLGMTDVKFAYAEGLAMGDKAIAASFLQFKQKISELIEKL